eukprot:GFKZ01013170.1.p1 GENE.GFKZ01013170.1~~GFKZ01013170.1.p1  ORF type:complete len:523 (-),score=75.07 GFKZ01013170.1:354-1922(-)
MNCIASGGKHSIHCCTHLSDLLLFFVDSTSDVIGTHLAPPPSIRDRHCSIGPSAHFCFSEQLPFGGPEALPRFSSNSPHPEIMVSFAELGLSPWLQRTCRTLGLTAPTPVQQACIPAILSGRDVIGAAETGTGKTAAFVLPILHALGRDPYGIAAVILTPTRELAFQIAQQVSALGAHIGVKEYTLVGGVDELSQATALQKKPHVVVATPGRMALMLRRDAVDLARARFLILDEADRLLDPVYLPDLKSVLNACQSERRQTLMFSATMTSSLAQLQEMAMSEDTFRFDARENRFATVDQLRQDYIFTPHNLKECNLVYLLKHKFPKQRVIIFVSKCETAELLVTMLNLLGMRKVTAMHSEMKQTRRIESLQRFKGHVVRALVATDLASRGLDIPSCEIVINYDIPRQVATYVHRVGRTARAGRGGLAISFVAQSDVELIHAIEEKTQRKLEEHQLGSEDTVMEELSATLKARQIARMTLNENGFMEQVDAKREDARKAAKKRKREKRKTADGKESDPNAHTT